MSKPFSTLALIDCCGTVQGTYDTTDEAESAMHATADYLFPMRIVELVEVVRCGECRFWHAAGTFCSSPHVDTETPADWFCADGRSDDE